LVNKGTQLTRVADIPGYPTRKLLFGGPETLTKAAMIWRISGLGSLHVPFQAVCAKMVMMAYADLKEWMESMDHKGFVDR
jgi:hypothetical protein